MIFPIFFDSDVEPQVHTRVKQLTAEYLAPVTNGSLYLPSFMKYLGDNYEDITLPQTSTRTNVSEYSLESSTVQSVPEKFTVGFYNDEYELIPTLPTGKKLKLKVRIKTISKKAPKVFL